MSELIVVNDVRSLWKR